MENKLLSSRILDFIFELNELFPFGLPDLSNKNIYQIDVQSIDCKQAQMAKSTRDYVNVAQF